MDRVAYSGIHHALVSRRIDANAGPCRPSVHAARLGPPNLAEPPVPSRKAPVKPRKRVRLVVGTSDHRCRVKIPSDSESEAPKPDVAPLGRLHFS
jgi:hypothetical protein